MSKELPSQVRACNSHLTVPLTDIAPLAGLATSLGVTAPSDGKRMRLHDYFQMQHHVAVKLRDESCQLSLRPLSIDTLSFVLESSLTGAAYFEQALQHVARAYNAVHGGSYNRVERHRNRLVYVMDDEHFPYAIHRDDAAIHTAIEATLLMLHAMFCVMTQHDLTPHLRVVRVRRSEHDPANGMLGFWATPVRCASPVYALEYSRATAALPLIRARGAGAVHAAQVFERAFALIAAREQQPLALDFVSRAHNAIARGVHQHNKVAQLLGVSTTTLRRRLAQRGESFSGLRSRVKAETAPVPPMVARRLLSQGSALQAGESHSELLLSPRERQLLNLFARGFSYADVAQLMNVSLHTVQTHVKNLYRKLSVRSRNEAVFEATRLGLLSPPPPARPHA
jgi:DNA-binding CsgD family transcriptional regulator